MALDAQGQDFNSVDLILTRKDVAIIEATSNADTYHKDKILESSSEIDNYKLIATSNRVDL